MRIIPDNSHSLQLQQIALSWVDIHSHNLVSTLQFLNERMNAVSYKTRHQNPPGRVKPSEHDITTKNFLCLPDRQGPRHCSLQRLELEQCRLHLYATPCHPP
jgi:hypothetical protein